MTDFLNSALREEFASLEFLTYLLGKPLPEIKSSRIAAWSSEHVRVYYFDASNSRALELAVYLDGHVYLEDPPDRDDSSLSFPVYMDNLDDSIEVVNHLAVYRILKHLEKREAPVQKFGEKFYGFSSAHDIAIYESEAGDFIPNGALC